MLKQAGHEVSGSDHNVYPPMSDYLAQEGIDIRQGYSPTNLEPRPDLAIIGNVIRRDNPEAQAVEMLGIPFLSMPQAINQIFLPGKTSLVVAGTHGKTTTSSLLATLLDQCGQDPGFMIGGIVRRFGKNARLGHGPFFVLEGDEYDTAFFDKGPKFLHYAPRHAIITSVEFDHADIYRDLDHVKDSFRRLVGLMPPDGSLVAHADDPVLADVLREAPCPVARYGFSPAADWRIEDVAVRGAGTSFSVIRSGQDLGRFTFSMPGRHNALNAVAVMALLHGIGIPPSVCGPHLATFEGVRRRQEVRGVVADVTVIDDFAHHPTAVKETLAALREKYAGQRIVAVFEPRTNSSRRSVFQEQYAEVFGDSDLVWIREPVPIDSLADGERFSAARLVTALCQRGAHARLGRDTDEILARLLPELRPGDVVAILSNGGFDNIHERLLAALRPA